MNEGTNTKKASKPKYRAEFLKRLRTVWMTKFPFLVPAKPGVLGEFRKSDAVFTITPELTKHSKFVHIWICFVPKPNYAGEFTVEIFFHELEFIPNPDHLGRREEFSTGKNGGYRIGGPIDAPHGDWWWTLKDNHGENIAMFEKYGIEPHPSTLNRPEGKWFPSTYDQPFAGIVEEAITDLNRNLREKVFPLILKRAG